MSNGGNSESDKTQAEILAIRLLVGDRSVSGWSECCVAGTEPCSSPREPS